MKVVLGLGGNEGDRAGCLRGAIRLLSLSTPGLRVLRASPLYESQAMLPADAPADGSWNRPFLNLALECETSLEPESLLSGLKAVERKLGRETRSRWAPRRIDIDILASDGPAVSLPGLEIPHPGLLERPFALLPLADLWPAFEARARKWRASATERVPFGTHVDPQPLCELVGILNITPDSFSDGGLFLDPARAAQQAKVLVAAGATVLDIGAESTRPAAHPLEAEEEWGRLAPVLEAMRGTTAILSVDTRHPGTAARAIRAGAGWINDVEGLESAEMRREVADSSVDVVVMHSLGIPPDSKRVLPEGNDPVEELLAWGERKLRSLEESGIGRDRVILDPGIGFGKLAFQSWLLLSGARRLHELGCRVLIGHSRKSFLALITDRKAEERDPESAVLAARLAAQGIQYLRVHDVEGTLRALRAAQRLEGIVQWR
jgi:2-amino-4-hydroxy-6-hydroxymethyldihydropteridine diphosphokinase/dihydropteroate synthase